MLGSGGFRLAIAHPDQRQFNLQRRRPNQAGKLDFRLNFAALGSATQCAVGEYPDAMPDFPT